MSIPNCGTRTSAAADGTSPDRGLLALAHDSHDESAGAAATAAAFACAGTTLRTADPCSRYAARSGPDTAPQSRFESPHVGVVRRNACRTDDRTRRVVRRCRQWRLVSGVTPPRVRHACSTLQRDSRLEGLVAGARNQLSFGVLVGRPLERFPAGFGNWPLRGSSVSSFRSWRLLRGHNKTSAARSRIRAST